MDIQENKHGAVAVLKPVGPVVQADAEQLKGRLLQVQQAEPGASGPGRLGGALHR